ncbi:tetratricopeptide repeat protein [Marivirga sp. S37H4]|uniref:Tetratricopeptide repeat protein n=1 Tax=Marivirga aurantiaca TaxID=2802615 RepID=A0A934WWG1_9BACT|nr:tetratricopeptide repeat protein [Marivirga aurantiaca]MBK6264212.1 tetratricopeptide repeat protein [Marivirga aurantiaca]
MKLRSIFYLMILSTMLLACNDKDNAEIGNDFYSQGEYQKAIDSYNEYLKLKPSDEIILYNRGRAYEELGQYDKALRDFKKVIEIDPKNESALLSFGKSYFREKDYKNAAFQFEKAFKLNTSSSKSALLLARALHRDGQVEEAMEYYNIAISNDNKNGEAYMYRGALKIFLNQMSGGCSDIQKAKNMNTEEAESLYNQYCK